MREFKIVKDKLKITDEIECVFEKRVTKFGTGAKIDASKEHLGKKVYILVRKEQPERYLNKISIN